MMAATDIFVTVHGIGDQVEYQTVQYSIQRVTTYLGQKVQVPLGQIGSGQNDCGVYEHREQREAVAAFAEVYWADIPRQMTKDGYKLEEATQWARHLVDKLDRMQNGCFGNADRRTIKAVLPEAIQTIEVLQRLLRLAEWGMKFKFDLKWVLDNFLGDVQVVAEFQQSRDRILERFDSVMENCHAYNRTGNIYVIAHSEGSVVAFLGLLKALSARATWLTRVKGLMTIGSPIDKHLILWPELWEGLSGSAPGVAIPWHNYCDRGDPVGYELDQARQWLGHDSFLLLKDVQFSRYLFPGKAHTDYWKDDELFCDFLSAVGITGTASPPQQWERPWTRLFSSVLPFFFSLVILAGGVFIFYNAITACIDYSDATRNVIANTLAFTSLMAGIGVAGRVPRLVRDLRDHFSALLVTVLFWLIFYRLVQDNACYWIAETLYLLPDPKVTIIGLAGLVVMAGYLFPLLSDRSGTSFFICVGGISALGLALAGIYSGDHGNIMPVLLAGGMFIYLLWLAVLIFDLSFIWHRFIRNSMAVKAMRDCQSGNYQMPMLSGKVLEGQNALALTIKAARKVVGN